MLSELTLIQKVAIWALPVIFAITLHEVAHGWAASKFGDQTAKMLGRLSLNPIKHIDPLGTVVVPVLLLMMGGFVFGWAKAVPVDTRNFKNPARDMAWVAVAGPGANLVMAVFWAIVAKIGMLLEMNAPEIGLFLIYSGMAGVTINLVLLVLNLIPIPPLDGSRVVSAFLPKKLAWQYNLIAPYGFFIILGLLFLGLLTPIMMGPYAAIKDTIYALVGI